MTDLNPIQPHLQVVAGSPSDEELAVAIAVLQAAASSAASQAAPVAAEPVSKWHRSAGTLRGSVVPGHNQWRASYRSGLN